MVSLASPSPTEAEGLRSVQEATPQAPVTRSALWVVIARGWSVAASAALGLVLPRWFGENAAAYGEVMLLISLVGIASMIASFGLPETMIRLVAARLAKQQPAAVRTLVHRAAWLLVWTTLITAGVTACYFWLHGFRWFHIHGSLWLAAVIGLAIIALAWQLVAAAVLRGLHEVKWANLLSGGQSGGPLAVTGFLLMVAVLFLLLPATAVSSTRVAQLLMVAIIGTAGLTFWRLWRTLPPRELGASIPGDIPTVVELGCDAFPLALSQIAAFCTISADLWLVGKFLAADVAYYGSAKRLVLLLGVPEQLAMLTIIALIPDLYARGRLLDLQQLVRKATTLAFLPALVAAVALLALPQTVLRVIFGEQYAVAAIPLVILTVAQLTSSWMGPSGYVLLMTGRRWTVLGITLGCGIAAIVFGALGAYFGGMRGLAVASAICTTAQFSLEWLAARYYVGIWCHASPWLLATPGKLAAGALQAAPLGSDSHVAATVNTVPLEREPPL